MRNDIRGSADASYRPIAVQILADDETVTVLTAGLKSIPAITVSPARHVASPADLNLDLASIKQVLSNITVVVTAVDSAKKLVNLLFGDIHTQPRTFIVKIGSDRIEISGGTDMGTARRLLEAALHVVA
jgi:hypothetical protein